MKAFAFRYALATALLASSATLAVAQPVVKPPIRGLVSMGAFEFMGYGGDPVGCHDGDLWREVLS